MSETIELMQLLGVLLKEAPVPEGLFGTPAQTAQLIAAVRAHFAAIGLPSPPPEHLQRRVVGGYVAPFDESGFTTITGLNAALASSVGRTIGDFRHVLDFGVGCGRTIRSVAGRYPELRRTGADIDAEAIAWLSAHYGRYGDFVQLPHQPPSSFAAETFDLVYAVSVFTHLPEDLQFAWLAELRRITEPGAILLLSVHGENYLRLLPEDMQAKAAANGGFFYNDEASLTDGLPGFYKNTYHTQDYIYRQWQEFFDILAYRPLSLEHRQDLVVCRRR